MTQVKFMAMNHVRSIRGIAITREAMGVVSWLTFSSGKEKKGSKVSAASDAPKKSILSKEVKSTTVVGATILKDGADPKILPDSEYADWLWHLIDKRSALSELRRKNTENLPYENLKHFVKLDNRSRIKENNSFKAKNWTKICLFVKSDSFSSAGILLGDWFACVEMIKWGWNKA